MQPQEISPQSILLLVNMQIIKPRVPVINWNNPITKGLVFEMPLFERGGTTVIDKNLSKITGTLTNSPTWVTDLVGIGVKFVAASSQYIQLSKNPTTANVGTDCAIEALIKPTTLPQTAGTIFHLGQDNSYGFGLNIGNGSGGSGSQLEGLNDSVAWIGGGPTLTNNVVQHVGFVHRNSQWYYYLNGVEYASGSNTTNGGMNSGATIGASQSSTLTASRFFDGIIFYVRYWTRGLAKKEFQQLAANPFQIYSQPGLLRMPN